jgi:hypothetical protein
MPGSDGSEDAAIFLVAQHDALNVHRGVFLQTRVHEIEYC